MHTKKYNQGNKKHDDLQSWLINMLQKQSHVSISRRKAFNELHCFFCFLTYEAIDNFVVKRQTWRDASPLCAGRNDTRQRKVAQPNKSGAYSGASARSRLHTMVSSSCTSTTENVCPPWLFHHTTILKFPQPLETQHMNIHHCLL